MTPASKKLVQESWSLVVPMADTAAQLFYARLFQIAPETRALFRSSDLQEQGRKLMQMITVAVRGLDRLDDLVPAVEAMGRRHGGYGVQDSHYDLVGAVLLWTLQQGLGDRFTAEVRSAWAETYELLATMMKRAAAGLSALPPTVPVTGIPAPLPPS